MKKVLLVTLLIVCGVSIRIFGINKFWSIVNEPSIIYKINWDIDIPNPINYEYIINSYDTNDLIVMHYTKENMDVLISKDFFKRIEDNESEFKKEYHSLIRYRFQGSLSDENKEIFNEKVNVLQLKNKNNYYAIFKEDQYNFEMLILDYDNNDLYAFRYFE